MTIDFIRHATFILQIFGKKILVDPMLSDKDALDPVANCNIVKRIPMTSLPFSKEELQHRLLSIDAVLVTHTHRDHWDVAAQQLVPKHLPLFCQPSDREIFRAQGFEHVMPIESSEVFGDIVVHRTNGQHGTGEIGKKMGLVSGFVIEADDEKIYIAGDTIWCDEVQDAIEKYQPKNIVVNAGGAQFDTGDPITMTAHDIEQVINAAPDAKIIIVHMDTVNHCRQSREDTRRLLFDSHMLEYCQLPMDGEMLATN